MKAMRLALFASTGGLAIAAPAFAQEGDGVSDIIVTARRVEERLQDVPISMTVFNQQQISDRNVTNGAELATYTPSLSANSRFGSENVSFAIRGFTQEARTTASVGVYFADVVAPRGGTSSIATGDGAGPGSFFDLQNVQVLKGPQGTLFGRNTTGGAVLLVPRKPSGDFEGYVEGTVGDYDLRRVQAVANIPVMDSLRIRLGIDRQTRDGFLKNVSPLGPRDFGDVDYWAFRASIVADLTPNLENYTIISYSRSATNGQLAQVQQANTLNFPAGVLSQQQIDRERGLGDYAVSSSFANPYSTLMTWQVINTMTWRASDTLTIKNIASYSQLRNAFQQDFFGTDWIIPATLTNPNNGATFAGGAQTGLHSSFNTAFVLPGGSIADQGNFTEELQFQGSSFADRLVWQAGGYLELSDPLSDNSNYALSRATCTDRFTLQCTSNPGATGALTVQKFRTAYHSYGFYAQGSYSLTDTLKVTGGLRYTWDLTRASGYNVQVRYAANPPGTPGPTSAICANPNVGPQRGPGQTTQPTITPTLESFEQCRDTPRVLNKAPTWLIGLDWKPMENALLYAKYARGYRQGSANVLSAGGFTTWQPERVDSYEIGAKASWRGTVPGYFNVSGFYNDLQNQQIQLSLISSAGVAPVNQAIINIGKSRLQGVEVEAGIGPFHGLRLEGSYAYIDAVLKSTARPVLTGTLYDTYVPINAGQPAPFTPKNKYSLTATYELPVPENVGKISFGVNYSFTDKQFVVGSAFGTLPSYDLLNLNLNWTSIAGSALDAALFVTNATDKKYAVAVSDMYATNQSGYVSYFLGQPRMFGVRLRYNLGN